MQYSEARPVQRDAVGAVKSRLCDEGAPCVLTIPSMVRGQSISVGGAGAPDRRLIGFRCGDDEVLVELLMQKTGG